jgi:hypothetical protein
MNITQATSVKDQSQESDIGYLLDWVYYHNTLSRFSIHHWRHKALSPRATAAQNLNPGEELQYPSLARYRIVKLTENSYEQFHDYRLIYIYRLYHLRVLHTQY